MQLFYNSTIDSSCENFFFDKEESKHIIKVLRKKEGDILHVTNGLGSLFETEIILASDSKCTVKLVSLEQEVAHDYPLHMVVAPTKMNDRFEWFLEKATEIGVQEITPIICDRSERKVINKERFEKVIITALKQCNSLFLPKLNEVVTLKEFLHQSHEGDLFIAHCEETERKSLKSALHSKTKTTIMIGPEGDFSTNEIELAKNKGFIPVTLGNTRLRTETAAVVACHSVVFFNE